MEKKTQIGESRLSNLYKLSEIITSTLEPKEVLSLIIDAAVRISGATSGSLRLIDLEALTLRLEVACGLSEGASGLSELKIGEGVTGWVAKTGKPLLVPDVTRDERYVVMDDNIRSELAVPLVLEGQVIGVVNVNSTKLDAFTQEDLELLSTLASQSAKVIQNAKLYDALRRKANELSTLFNVGKIITGTLNLEEVLNQIVEKASYLMNTKLCSLMLLNEDGMELIIKAVHGGSPDYAQRPNLKVDESLIGGVVKTKRPLTALDVRQVPGYKYLDLARREGLCSLLSVPLIFKEQVIGIINVYKSTQDKFTSDEIGLLSNLADQSAMAIQNARLYEQMMNLEEGIRRIEKLGVLGELAVEVAHEVRNPLTIIKMLLHALKVDNSKDVEVIEGEIDRINKIVTQFLDYARPGEPVLKEIDVNRILDTTLILLSHRLNKRKIELVKDLPSVPRLSADPDKLEQAFLNLFLNAIDAMPSGGRLKVSTRTSNGYVQIEIGDSGVGIPPQIKNKLFKPFTTTKEGGLGLGLSVVHRIVEGHKGRIAVESTPEHGTAFTISLPLENHRDR